MGVRLFVFAAALLLAACTGPAEPVWAPEEEVQRRAFIYDGPPKLTLYTVVSTRSGFGAHSGLLVNGPTRILFDSAGTFRHPAAPERNDVHHGITENILKVYIDYHARETYDVMVQELEVSAETAAAVWRAVQSNGAVPKAQCSLSTTRILSRIPGFETIPVGYFPNRTARAFGALPGAKTSIITDDDADANHGVLLVAQQGFQDRNAKAE